MSNSYSDNYYSPDLLTCLNPSIRNLQGLELITEHHAISSDSYKQRVNKTFINSHLGKFNEYKNNEDGSIFRIVILHPNKSEAITGADLIYEQYDIERKQVRIVAIQYKVWEKGVLYFSQSGSLNNQIKRMKGCFCDDNYCCDENKKNSSVDLFRLPYCSAFLRPTDKLQNPNSLITSGFHVPICKIDSIKTQTHQGDKLEYKNVAECSIKSQTFEELFNLEKIGSRWLSIVELEKLYRQSAILEPNRNIILYAQTELKIR